MRSLGLSAAAFVDCLQLRVNGESMLVLQENEVDQIRGASNIGQGQSPLGL